MRAVVQRVRSASVEIEGQTVGEIGVGILVYLGVASEDDDRDVHYTAEKCANLRIFDDESGTMNRSLLDSGGEILVVSQFTLYGDTRKGRRPSYNRAARPEIARERYQAVVDYLQTLGVRVATGRYRAEMAVNATVDGPVTILIDSHKEF
jgi:D-tyrosyl-tRNA(Tyr) deacylase